MRIHSGLTRRMGILAALATGASACGALPRIDRASIKVRSSSRPVQVADVNKASEQAPVPVNPAPAPAPGPSPAPAVDPAPPATPAPDAPPPPPPPVIISKSFSAKTGPTVATNSITIVYGTNPTFERIEVRRLAGSSAPDCTTGIVVKELFKPFVDKIVFNDQTDAAWGEFAYRVCYFDANGVAEASAEQLSSMTKAHILFVSAPTLTGNLNGASGAAATCRANAVASNMMNPANETTWQAVLSDNNMQARERVQVLGRVSSTVSTTTQSAINFADTATDFWGSGLMANPAASILDNTGHASQSLVWTGSDGAANSTGNTCSNWTTNSPMVTGDSGDATTLSGVAWLNGGAPSDCGQLRAIYCMSEQPPMMQAATGASMPHSVDLTITPSDQRTVGGSIEIRRRAYAAGVPSADCVAATETPILTINPLTGATTIFNDDQASGNTAYNYRACLFDKKGQVVYSTLLMHVVTSP